MGRFEHVMVNSNVRSPNSRHRVDILRYQGRVGGLGTPRSCTTNWCMYSQKDINGLNIRQLEDDLILLGTQHLSIT